MATERQRTRRLAWEACLNARDLGGYPLPSGRETRWGAIVRSDTLSELTTAGCAALVEYGVRTIVDLRLPMELEEAPNPFAQPGPHGVAYLNASFINPTAPPVDGFTTLANDYKRMLDRFAPEVVAIMTAIAGAPEGPVLVHCMAGKDRTGLVCALLLELVGVPRETIGADYALTAESFRTYDEEFLANGPGERAEREQLLVTYSPRAEVMLEVLAHLDERYGGAEAYLLASGVAPEDITRLRARLLPALDS